MSPRIDNILDQKEMLMALSDMFIHIDYIASAVCEYDIEIAFFEYVAPICYTNLLGPLPSIWAGFEEVSLMEEMEGYQLRNKNIFVKCELAFLRYYCKKDWLDLKKGIEKLKYV